MTIREQIGKKCKPCIWAIFIGAALVMAGIFFYSLARGAPVSITANYCSLCGISFDAELPVDKINAASIRKQQRKEWPLHLAHAFPVLLYGVFLILAMTLFSRILYLEGDRSGNAKSLGQFYAQACKNGAGEKIMRQLFTEQLSRAKTPNSFERWLLPKHELVYRQEVLNAFEKELRRIKDHATVTEENIQE